MNISRLYCHVADQIGHGGRFVDQYNLLRSVLLSQVLKLNKKTFSTANEAAPNSADIGTVTVQARNILANSRQSTLVCWRT